MEDFDPNEVKYSDVRAKLEAADDALTQAIDLGRCLSEHTDPVAVGQATGAATLAYAVAGKATTVADLLHESVTVPVVG